MDAVTPTRRAALEFVAAGKLQYSLSIGTWEPTEGYRQRAFDWLDGHGLIEPDYEGEPRGKVLRVVDVHVTEAGRKVLDAR